MSAFLSVYRIRNLLRMNGRGKEPYRAVCSPPVAPAELFLPMLPVVPRSYPRRERGGSPGTPARGACFLLSIPGIAIFNFIICSSLIRGLRFMGRRWVLSFELSPSSSVLRTSNGDPRLVRICTPIPPPCFRAMLLSSNSLLR